MKTLKNNPQKLLIIGPNLFFNSPDHSQKPRIDFSQDPSVSLPLVDTPKMNYLDRYWKTLGFPKNFALIEFLQCHRL